ncbi:MAG: EAL domain-containing protein, partial [Spirochaetales bacterium]|nr:EAL domain-containing protein [Spirochaetales bacterium]
EKARNACNSLKKSKAETVAVYNDALYEKELLGERLMNEMQKAIEEQQFKVWFQPKFNIRGDKPVLCSAEALVRWKHPELGMVSPGVFIPLFEQNGLIQDLDLYVWRTAACQIAHWKELFGLSIPVSVNVSRIELFDPSLKDKIVGILEENGLGFDDIALEITESAYSSDSSQLVQAVRVLQNAGFRIEIDDFGTGYSSLNRLAEMPVDVIKLDMSFVRRIHENSTMLSIVQLIIQMAKSLGAPVIAEGVELEQQYQLLKEMGCDIVQGYYFSKPLPSEDFETFIKDNR